MENPFEIIIERLNNIEQLLHEIKNNQKAEKLLLSDADELMNVKRVAEYLTLSTATIYGLISKMAIPNMKRGKRLYFKKRDIDEWLSKSLRKTKDEIESEANAYISKKMFKLCLNQIKRELQFSS